MSEIDKPGEKEIERGAATPKKMPAPLPKQYGPKGKPSRAESHKGNKVQPAHQRNRRQKGR